MAINIIRCDDYNQASKKTAEIIASAMQKQPDMTLGLATGSTPLLTYKYLIEAYQKNEISFKDIKTFNLDEYLDIDPKHPQSYSKYMEDNLFDHIDIDFNHVFIPTSNGNNPNEAAKRYNQKLKENPIDLQLLGLGINGHIGFNEPGTPFDSETAVVELALETRQANARFFLNIEDVATHAITIGIANIMAAKEIVLLACGDEKADAVQKMIEGPVSVDLPASILQRHPHATIVLDRASASKLTKQF